MKFVKLTTFLWPPKIIRVYPYIVQWKKNYKKVMRKDFHAEVTNQNWQVIYSELIGGRPEPQP